MEGSAGHAIGSAVSWILAATAPGEVTPLLTIRAATPVACGDAIDMRWRWQ
jgi:pimeloyl-ACP methyl ester carboxylesterase